MKWEPLEGEKQCSRCHKCKPQSEFAAKRGQCRDCRKAINREYAAARAPKPRKSREIQDFTGLPVHEYTPVDHAFRAWNVGAPSSLLRRVA